MVCTPRINIYSVCTCSYFTAAGYGYNNNECQMTCKSAINLHIWRVGASDECLSLSLCVSRLKGKQTTMMTTTATHSIPPSFSKMAKTQIIMQPNGHVCIISFPMIYFTQVNFITQSTQNQHHATYDERQSSSTRILCIPT